MRKMLIVLTLLSCNKVKKESKEMIYSNNNVKQFLLRVNWLKDSLQKINSHNSVNYTFVSDSSLEKLSVDIIDTTAKSSNAIENYKVYRRGAYNLTQYVKKNITQNIVCKEIQTQYFDGLNRLYQYSYVLDTAINKHVLSSYYNACN